MTARSDDLAPHEQTFMYNLERQFRYFGRVVGCDHPYLTVQLAEQVARGTLPLRDAEEKYWRDYVAARGGPSPVRHPRKHRSERQCAFSEYLARRMKERDDEAIAAASTLLGWTFDVMNAEHRAAYNAALLGLKECYPLTGKENDPSTDLWKVQSNEKRRHEQLLLQQLAKQKADRTAQVETEAATFRAAYIGNLTHGASQALTEVEQLLLNLKTRNPDLARACGFKLMAFLTQMRWPQTVVINAGVAAGLARAIASVWVRTKLLA